MPFTPFLNSRFRLLSLSFALFIVAFTSVTATAAEKAVRDDSAAESLGWRLGVQAYTFRKFTLFETIDIAQSLGLKYIELYPGQRISKDRPGKSGHDMSAEDLAAVKKKLTDAGVKAVNYGVVGLFKNERESRKVFEFAKAIGLETIVTEAAFDAYAIIDTLALEYDVKVAIHNHPKPSRFWNAETVLRVCDGRSRRIGSCSDTGHWMRSGVDPIESLQKLKGRVITFHLKQIKEFGKRTHDVPFGTGNPDFTEKILHEMKKQGFKGVFSIEYEHNADNPTKDVAQCIKFFDRIAGELAGK